MKSVSMCSVRRFYLAVTGLGLLAFIGPGLAQDREASPGPNWVFQEDAYYGDIKIVEPSRTDKIFPININNHWGLMNERGFVITFPQFDWTDYGYEGLARAMVEGKTGFISGNGSWVIPPDYDYADRFVDGLAVVGIEGRFGMIDKSNEFIIPLEYTQVLRFQDGFAAVYRDGRCGFINRRGDLRIPMEYKQVRSFHNGFAAVQHPNDRWGYINKRGRSQWIDESGQVTMLGDFHEQYARLRVTTSQGVVRWGYITKAFRLRVDPIYEDARDFHNGIAAVKVDGKWGFIYPNGRWVIEPQFDEVDDFDNAVGSNDFEDPNDREQNTETGRGHRTAGLYAKVKIDGRWGYVNRAANGGLVPQFEEADPFYLGLARVSRADSFAYIDESGHVVFDPVSAAGGLINQTLEDRARQTQQSGERSPSNAIQPPPPLQDQAPIPYEREHLYEELLPQPDR